MSRKKWIKIFFLFSFIVIGSVGSINYIMDPLWTFSHAHQFNSKQNGFNERQQKTNHIYFNGLDHYDGILLGSSRTTYINQNDFHGMNIYNYALNSMYPFEYKDYIDFAKEYKNEKLKYIIIGADFYGTNTVKDVMFENPKYYIDQTKTFLYRYKMLFSLDTLRQSLGNVKLYLFGKKRYYMYYTRRNVRIQNKVSEREQLERYKKNIIKHTYNLSNEKYVYDKNYKNVLKQIKNENPKTKIIVFTPPITADLFVSIMKYAGRFNDYKKWLHELVTVFEEVYCFMDINSITRDLKNYADDDHAYSYIGKLVANKISDYDNENIPNDFGILINKDNIDSFIDEQNNKIQVYKFNSIFPGESMESKLKLHNSSL